MSEELGKYKETIQGWTFLTGKCSTCGSEQVVVRVHSHRQYANPRVYSGDQVHDYCKDHIPAYVVSETAAMWKHAQTPFGANG